MQKLGGVLLAWSSLLNFNYSHFSYLFDQMLILFSYENQKSLCLSSFPVGYNTTQETGKAVTSIGEDLVTAILSPLSRFATKMVEICDPIHLFNPQYQHAYSPLFLYNFIWY